MQTKSARKGTPWWWQPASRRPVATLTKAPLPTSLPRHSPPFFPGMALGMVTQLPETDDETSVSRRQLLAKLDVCMGGRVAEELIFGGPTAARCPWPRMGVCPAVGQPCTRCASALLSACSASLLRCAGERDVTTGASSDLEQATRLARAMVTRYGMSDKIGQVGGGEWGPPRPPRRCC